jgi:ABC-type polysaccharide/polyol phosphate transport system ATPase subunit
VSETAIYAQGLGKRYRVGERERYLALRDLISRAISAPFREGSRRQAEVLWALRDVSFEVKQGEVVGLIGRNGAGKSTLLKVLSRITKPTSGWAEVHGRVGSLLEVGTGFHPELTGRENIYLSGAILGMKRTEIDRKFNEIVAFAEVERFLESQLKHFSTGMQMRLAFAVAAHLEPEILLVDEVLAVGDLEFQKKCLGKMGEVSKGGRTIVFVSHQMSQIRRLCERVIWIDDGGIRQDGATLDVLSAYETAFTQVPVESRDAAGGIRDVYFQKWELLHEECEPRNVLRHFGPVCFRMVVRVPEAVSKGHYAIQLVDDDGRMIWHGNFSLSIAEPGTFEFVHRLPTIPIKPGAYRWKAAVYNGRRWSDVWWAVPDLIIGTTPMTHTADQFQALLNLPCELEVKRLLDPVEPDPQQVAQNESV